MTDESQLRWRKSSFSNNTCVEVALINDYVMVRNSTRSSPLILIFKPDEWEAFLTGVRNNEFDIAALEKAKD
jgi:hypothetical protein